MNGEMEKHVDLELFFGDSQTNRRRLFEEALKYAEIGKVLYILREELEELPELSQDLNSTNRHYMKMISFLYVKSLESLIESLSTLPDWQHVPSTIILDDLNSFCCKNALHTAYGLVAFLLDSVRSCSESIKKPCVLRISATKGVLNDDNCNILKELYKT